MKQLKLYLRNLFIPRDETSTSIYCLHDVPFSPEFCFLWECYVFWRTNTIFLGYIMDLTEHEINTVLSSHFMIYSFSEARWKAIYNRDLNISDWRVIKHCNPIVLILNSPKWFQTEWSQFIFGVCKVRFKWSVSLMNVWRFAVRLITSVKLNMVLGSIRLADFDKCRSPCFSFSVYSLLGSVIFISVSGALIFSQDTLANFIPMSTCVAAAILHVIIIPRICDVMTSLCSGRKIFEWDSWPP